MFKGGCRGNWRTWWMRCDRDGDSWTERASALGAGEYYRAGSAYHRTAAPDCATTGHDTAGVLVLHQ